VKSKGCKSDKHKRYD